MVWTVHFANASGHLDPFEAAIRASVEKARLIGEQAMPPVSLDLVVQNWPGRTIPELGFMGYAPTGDMIQLTFDAENDNLPKHLDDALVRTILHELHHVHRWRGPGYGNTLGAAVLSEGLAGHFVKECVGSPPEQWECAVDAPTLNAVLPRVRAEWALRHDHAEWFFGSGSLPNNLGYTLGYRIVGRHIARTERPASRLVGLRPDDVPSFEEEFS